MTRTRSVSFIAFLVLIAGLTGCAVGPHYKRPAVDVPGMYRGVTAWRSESGGCTPLL